jgi:hypothetical protein
MGEIALPNLAICVDAYLENTAFDVNELPSLLDPRSKSGEELALAKNKLWAPGQLLRVRFLDGEEALWKKVERHAREWLEYANLEFEFGNFPDAEIRITFKGYGYWSLVGADALRRPSPIPTMGLGKFTAHTDPVELKQVVLHEFGHALGCVHEQASPSIVIPWDREKVYAYYESQIGWDRDTVDHNVFARYKKHEVYFTQRHDPLSIMQYPVPKELTIGGFEIGWNRELSEMDKAFIATMYPR